MTKNIKT